jgi:predicted Zn-dependent protease
LLFVLSGCQPTGGEGGFDLSNISLGGSGIAKHIGTGFEAAKGAYKASRPISDSEEYYIGRAVATKILAQYPYLNNQVKNLYINKVGQTLALHSANPQIYGGYHFALLDSPEINAFAAPGGLIFLTTGMLGIIDSEDALAAVLAHEISHVNRRHGTNAIKSGRWAEAVSMFSSKATAEYGPGELNQIVNIFQGSIDDVFKTLVVKGYGRPQELEADSDAVLILQRAGYDPGVFLDFLVKLQKIAAKTNGGGILSTHPGLDKRIEAAAALVPATPPELIAKSIRSKRYQVSIAR